MSDKGVLSHVEIYVSDLSRASEFWGWFLEDLGYERYQSWESGVSWKLGKTYIVFVQTTEKHNNATYHRCQTGLNHLAFIADSQAEVDQMAQKLKSRNVEQLYKDRFPHAGGSDSYAVFFEDPDRIKVEFVYCGE